jgi:hypothetical protein
MPSKFINTEITEIEDKDKNIDGKDSNFVKKSYTRPWEVELTDEQRENLSKSIEEDEIKYKEMGKRLAEDRDYSKLFNKNKKEK